MIDRRNISNLYPLSALQEGMLYHALREPQSRAYFEQIDFRVPAAVAVPVYLQAWQDLVARHDILRTVFAVRDLQQPLQVVLRERPLTTSHEDLRALGADAAEAAIADYRARDLAQGFELARTVPMRLALFTLAGGSHRAVWSFHHILLDGWSLAILQSELEQLYQARLAGHRAALAAPVPYSAYIKWLGRRDRQQGLSFWQQRLQGLVLPTPVPRRLDARFAAATTPGGRGQCRHALGARAQDVLANTAAAHGVTTNLVVQSLWGLLLARLNGRRDAAFAATVSGRPHELDGAERTVGLFINAVAVRVRWQSGDTFAQLLARLQTESLAAQAHHDAPLAEVQSGHPLGSRLFDHILVFENYPQLERQEADESGQTVSLHEYTHYPFEFQFLPGARATLRFRFDTGLFDAAGVAALGTAFEALLLTLAQDAGQPLDAAVWPPGAWSAPRRIGIAASFTAEPVAEALAWWLSQLAIPSEVQLAPYNQCIQQLADPQSVLRGAELGVLLLRFADAARDLDQLAPDEACRRLDAQSEGLTRLVRERGDQPLLVALLPAASAPGVVGAHLRLLEQRWRESLPGLAGVRVIDLSALGPADGVDEVFDAVSDRIGHLPFGSAACEAIGGRLARAVHTGCRAPFKVIAVDCDNTLWDGVVGEVGVKGLAIGAGHRALQLFLLDQQRQGFLLALASKNREEDVWAVFDSHPDMVLRREHIAAWAIDWQPKSENLRRIAARLNVGADSIVFIDDSPLECAEVMQNCPEALAIALPSDPAGYAPWLAQVWAFDQAQVTEEDRDRTRMVQEESQRQAALASPGQDLLEQLQLVVRVGPVQPHQVARVAQLTQRTNQFNLSGVRRNEAQLTALMAQPECDLLAVEVEDRFGDYGLTGVAIVQRSGPSLLLETLLLSCRVLGRKVEFALLLALGRLAAARGCTRIEAQLRVTQRNEPVRLFLATAPWQPLAGDRFACERLDALAALPGLRLMDAHCFVPPAAGVADPAIAHAVVAAPHPGDASESARVARPPAAFPMPIGNPAQLRHAVHYLPLLAACAGWPRSALRTPARAMATGGRMPQGATEQAIAQIWGEVLGYVVEDAQADFAALGGHSLHAVRIVSRLERKFRASISLAGFFELRNIGALANWFDTAAKPADAIAAARIPRAPAAPDDPLSHNQQRLWMLAQMGGAGSVHQLCAAFRLRGALDAKALARAVLELTERHEALRTVFRLRGDQPRQLILPPAAGAFTVCSSDTLPSDTEVRERIRQRGAGALDLAAGPLFRAELHALQDGDAVLALYLHHIVSDGWSFGLLLDDLAGLYAQACGEPAAPVRPPSLQYRDFACWSRSEAGLVTQAADRAYWGQRLQSLPAIARIPFDFPAPALPSMDAAVASGVLPVGHLALQTWCAGQGASLFSLLAALVATLVSRCGGEEAVRLGMPAAGRGREELDDVVGFFANTTVLAATVAPEQSFAGLLAALQQDVNGALEHQSYPFDRLLADLQPGREPGRNPLFDVLVVLQNARGAQRPLHGLEATEFPVDTGLGEFDLAFEFGPGPQDQLHCQLRYRRCLYAASTAQLLLERLGTLLQAVLRSPATATQDLPLIGPQERRQLDAMADGGARAIPQASLAELFAAQAARTPHAVAVAEGGHRLDYLALDQRANALAHVLRARHHVQPGDVVAVLLGRGVEWAVALLAVLKAGAVYLPLDLQHPPQRLRLLLERSSSRVLIAAQPDQQPAQGLPIALQAPLDAAASEAAAPRLPIASTAPAYLIFTSGSTGEPKGVRVQHRAFVNMILAQIESFGVGPHDTVLQLASCAFDASLSELFMGWLGGACVAFASEAARRDGALLAADIRRHGATIATLTPSHLRQLDDASLRGLRKIVLAAEAVLGRDVERLLRLGLDVFNAYGPTETAVCATLMRVHDVPAATAAVPIGRPLPNLQLHIVDARGQDVPIGVAGQLVVHGAGVALGYLHGEDPAFAPGPDGAQAYRTGDSGRWLAQGTVEYLGRKDGQVKLRGQRVETGEVAAALNALGGVRQAEVLVLQGPAGPYLAACLCGQAQDDESIRAGLAARLPQHMVPARFVWLDAMPLTTSGKSDRAALLASCEAAPDRAPASAAPGPAEATLLALWQAALPGRVDAETDFFAAGGDSLIAMHAARRIAATLGQPCSPLQFFRTPTVRGMAAALAAQELCASVVSFGSGPQPVFALPPHPGLEAGYAVLAQALPLATLHVLPFTGRPVPELLAGYMRTVEELTGDCDPILLGYSGGGKLALALAHALALRRRCVAAVVLIDTWETAAAPDPVRRRMGADMEAAFPASADTALARAYRACIDALNPSEPITPPLYHLLAGGAPMPVPQGLSRDWSALAGGAYVEHRLGGKHHELLAAAHIAQTAAPLQALLAQAAGAAAAGHPSAPAPSSARV